MVQLLQYFETFFFVIFPQENPLLNCASLGCVEIAEYLLDRGAPINVINNSNFTPLRIAINKEQFPMVRLLLSRNCDANLRSKDGIRPICAASKFNLGDVLNEMLDHKVDVNQTDADGKNSFHVACEFAAEQSVDIILKRAPNLVNSLDNASEVSELTIS
jgi:ankyrin repeat protein